MLSHFTAAPASTRAQLRADLDLVLALLSPLLVLFLGLLNHWLLLSAVLLCAVVLIRPLRHLPTRLREAWLTADPCAMRLTVVAMVSVLFLAAASAGIVAVVAAGDVPVLTIAAVCMAPLLSGLWGRAVSANGYAVVSTP